MAPSFRTTKKGARRLVRMAATAGAIVGITTMVPVGSVGAQDAVVAQAQLAPLTFTETQARQGRAVSGGCAGCHGDDLAGLDSPPLVGDAFVDRWSAGPVLDLFDKIMVSMPADDPGTLSSRQTAMLVALIAERNGFVPGDEPLPEDPELLAQMGFAQ